jgi:hypothetical protein
MKPNVNNLVVHPQAGTVLNGSFTGGTSPENPALAQEMELVRASQLDVLGFPPRDCWNLQE